MITKTRTFMGYLISAFGLGLLLAVVVVPCKYSSNDFSTYLSTAPPKKRSSIRFSEGTSRLEPVHSGEISSGFILVENIGTTIITNVAVRASCTCSDLQLSDTTINPSETIRVDFSIDTRGKLGDFDEQFFFTYSEDAQSLFDVFYTVVPVLTPGKIVARPSLLQFNNARVGESFSKVIELQAKDLPENEMVDIVDISAPDWISLDLGRKETGWQLTVSGDFPNQSGRYVKFILIRSSSERFSETIIPFIIVYIKVCGDSP